MILLDNVISQASVRTASVAEYTAAYDLTDDLMARMIDGCVLPWHCIVGGDDALSFLRTASKLEAATAFLAGERKHIIRYLKACHNDIDWPSMLDDASYGLGEGDDIDCETVDCRLQLAESFDGWNVHTGDASYDQDHRGHWGASCLSADDNDETLAELADNLIDQCLESVAQSAD